MPKTNDYMDGLGANERAIIEKIPVYFLRKISATIIRGKVQLQFTGWLQYLVPLFFVAIFSMLGGLFYLSGLELLTKFSLYIGGILFIIVLFDIVTIKFKLGLPEKNPKRKDTLDLFDLMRFRRSCRSFQTRKLDEDDKNEIMDSVKLHLEEKKIGMSTIRFEYIHKNLTVWPVVNASEFLVAIVPKKYDRLAIIDVGRTLQKVVIDITRMGIGSCWIGPGADQKSIIEHLGDRFDNQKDHVLCVCAIGYKSHYIPLFIRIFNKITKNRLSLSKLFFTDSTFTKPLILNIPIYSKFKRTYEVCQWSPSSYNGQTTRCVGKEKNKRLSLYFYTKTRSRYYAPVALGIWFANWEMGCKALGIQGHFKINPINEVNQIRPKYDLVWIEDKK